jgi:nucleoside phosphorylase
MSSASDAQPDTRFHNIFLDFFNRDSRQIEELFRILGRERHLEILRRSLNLAIFLCRDHCIMPPGFAAEDELVRSTLSIADAYTHHRLVRWPIRESLDEYWAKKEDEYAALRSQYEGLFDKSAQAFVERNAHLLLERQSSIGSTLVERWEAAPDVDEYWRSQTMSVAPGVIEMFRGIPRQLLDSGIAVTWAAIHQRVAELARRFAKYRQLVQRIYFGIYMEEYDLRVLSGLPLARLSFGLAAEELFYRYEAIEAIVEPSGLWAELLQLPPWDMVRLRGMPDYFEFRQLAFELCRRAGSLYDLREAVALAPSETERLRAATGIVDPAIGQLSLSLDGHSEEWVEAFAARLAGVASIAYERTEERVREAGRARVHAARARAALRRGKEGPVRLAIFTALKEERDVMIDRWGLVGVEGVYGQWEGSVGSADVVLYGAERLGRVPAAVATARLLGERDDVDMIVVVGIAGGFGESGVSPGAVLIPYRVADLALRKVTGGDSKVRPEPYDVDRRLGRYVENQFHNKENWIAAAIKEARWPDDRRPHLRSGETIACLDEVVADDDYRARLLDAWPKLQGVEMEAGGVIAAAREFGPTPVAVVRAVSDMADPAKADDEWRWRGMLTITMLFEQLDWPRVMAMAG